MIYKLLNFLFGWQYIAWRNSCDSGIARVHITSNGVVWYWRYKNINVFERITHVDQVIWLTGSPPSILLPEVTKDAEQERSEL